MFDLVMLNRKLSKIVYDSSLLLSQCKELCTSLNNMKENNENIFEYKNILLDHRLSLTTVGDNYAKVFKEFKDILSKKQGKLYLKSTLEYFSLVAMVLVLLITSFKLIPLVEFIYTLISLSMFFVVSKMYFKSLLLIFDSSNVIEIGLSNLSEIDKVIADMDILAKDMGLDNDKMLVSNENNQQKQLKNNVDLSDDFIKEERVDLYDSINPFSEEKDKHKVRKKKRGRK